MRLFSSRDYAYQAAPPGAELKASGHRGMSPARLSPCAMCSASLQLQDTHAGVPGNSVRMRREIALSSFRQGTVSKATTSSAASPATACAAALVNVLYAKRAMMPNGDSITLKAGLQSWQPVGVSCSEAART